MKIAYLLAASPSLLLAGPDSLAENPGGEDWLTPTVEFRARHEFNKVDGLDDSHALTARARFGLRTRAWHGFSAFVEGEFTRALIDDYDSPGVSGLSPQTPGNAVIADPENDELNQVYLQWEREGTLLRAGRQYIQLDSGRIIGGSPWRQNERTYDALSLKHALGNEWHLFAAYANRINRIFGSDARGETKRFEGDIGMLNLDFRPSGSFQAGAFAYYMNFDKTAPAVDFISNKSAGFYLQQEVAGVTLYGQSAYQTGTSASASTRPDDALYYLLTASRKVGDQRLTLGWEYFSAGYVTPAASVHPFNGFADVFGGVRRGLGAGNPGFADLYLRHDAELASVSVRQELHLYGGNDSNYNFGWEYDLQLQKKWTESLASTFFLAYYKADEFGVDTTKAGLSLEFTF